METLRKFEIPQWYKDAKFGIFIHWSAFSVPGSNEWYPRNMYQQKDPAFKEHIQRFGAHDEFGYKDFIPMFKAEKWDPADWARLFKQAVARYVIPPPSITTDSPCMPPISRIGQRRKWGRSGM